MWVTKLARELVTFRLYTLVIIASDGHNRW